MKRRTVIVLLLASFWLGRPPSASAHRVDEYLQATRVSVERSHIRLEMSLTPGIDVAPLVFSWIDANHDGQISRHEEDSYAQEVLRSIELLVDGRPVAVILTGQSIPEFREMRLGTGTIRLQAEARLSSSAAGAHQVVYRNRHKPEWSV